MPGFIIGALISSAIPGIAGAIIGGIASFAVSSLFSGALGGKQDRPQQSTLGRVQAQGRLVTVRQPIGPWQVIYGEARVGGVLTFAEESVNPANTGHLFLVVTFAGHPVHQFGLTYFDDEAVPLDELHGWPTGGGGTSIGALAGHVLIHRSIGTEPALPHSNAQPFTTLVGYSDLWTDEHCQTGRTKMFVSLSPNPDLFPSGVPNITAVIKGRKIVDPRVSPQVRAYSNNVALCLYDYLTSTDFGLGFTEDEVDLPTLIAAANVCDELVELAGSPTTYEKRYTCNGSFTLAEEPKAIIERLLSAMAGWAVKVGAKWYIFAGAYEVPTIDLTESDLAGPIQIQPLISRNQNANGVKGVFVDPNQSWQPVDFPPITGDAYLAEDNNERVWRDVDMSAFVTSGSQAQRLAKIELLRTRQGLSVSGTFKLSAFRAVTGRTVSLTIARYGWSAKAFDVVGCSFAVADDGTLGVRLDLRETAAAIYDWSTSDEQAIDIAPNTNLPDPRTIPAPTDLAFEQSASVWDSVMLSWTASTNPFLAGYQAEYRLTSPGSPGGSWTPMPTTFDTGITIPRLQPRMYDFRVKAISIMGVSSAYAELLSQQVLGPTVRPFGSFSGLGHLRLSTQIDLLTGTPAGAAWAPNVNLVFLAVNDTTNGYRVAVINPINDEIIDSILTTSQPNSAPPTDCIYCPTNGKIYALTGGLGDSDGVDQIDPYSFQVDRFIALTGEPSGGCFCPTNGFLYITDQSNVAPTVKVVDPQGSPQIAATISMGGGGTCYAAVFCPTNGSIYVPRGINCAVINPATNTVSVSITGLSGGARYAAYCSANDRIYLSSTSGVVHVINPNTNTVETTITGGSPSVFGSLQDIAYSNDSGFIYVADNTNGKVHAILPSSNAVVSSTEFLPSLTRMLWVPSADKIYVSANNHTFTASGV